MKRYLACLVVVAACSKHVDEQPAAGSAAVEPAAAGAKHHHEDRHDPAEAAPPLSLAVTIDGSAATWAQDVFDKTPRASGTNNDGEARDQWSLRDLVHGAAGSNARVVTVIGESKEAIDAAAWTDATRTPIVHRTKRGTLKFRWTDATGKWGETGVKEVTGLEVSTK